MQMPEPKLLMDWLSALGAFFWPIVILVIALMFRRAIAEWLRTADRLSVGPFEVKRELSEIAENSKRLLRDTSKLQILIAESRAIEVRVFLSYPLLSNEQRAEMLKNLEHLEQEIENLRKNT